MVSIICPQLKRGKCPKSLKFLASKTFGERGGVIPYYLNKNGTTHYLLGAKETKHGDKWSDFGGGRKRKETLLQCTLREFLEESRGSVNISINDITHVHIINSAKPYRVMLFIRLSHKDDNLPAKFRNIIPASKAEEELVKVKWFSEQKLLKLPKKNTSKSVREVINSGLLNV